LKLPGWVFGDDVWEEVSGNTRIRRLACLSVKLQRWNIKQRLWHFLNLSMTSHSAKCKLFL